MNRVLSAVLVLIAFAIEISLASAQVNFVRRVSLGNFTKGYAVQRAADGCFYMCGMYYSKNQDGRPFIIKTNPVGKIRWVRSFDIVQGDKLSAITATHDLGFAWLSSFTGHGTNALLIKCDSSGNMQWSSKLGRGSENGMNLIETFDHGYAVLSYKFDTFYPIVTKLDSTGKMQWYKGVTDGGLGSGMEASSIVQCSDSSFVIGGSNSGLARLSPSGNVLWQRRDSVEDNNSYQGGMTKTADNGFALCGSRLNDKNGDIYIARFDSSGRLLWGVGIDGHSNEIARDIRETNTGDFIVSGSTGSSFGDDSLIILRLSSQGQIKSSRIFANYDFPFSDGNALTLSSDTTIMIVGQVFMSSNLPTKDSTDLLYMDLTLDGEGCYLNDHSVTSYSRDGLPAVFNYGTPEPYSIQDSIPLSPVSDVPYGIVNLCSSNSVEDELEKVGYFSIFPNPVLNSGFVSIHLGRQNASELYQFRIYDLLGNILKSGMISLSGDDRDISLDINQLSIGSYVIELTSGDNFSTIYRAKFIKE